MPNRRRSWPFDGAASSPPAITASPDANLRSNRALAGPLRLGTSPGVGPSGAPDATGLDSDFGVDRVSPRDFDVLGTSDARTAVFPESELIARAGRRRRRG